MDASKPSMTLDEFLQLTPEQRRKMTARETGPFYAQMAVINLNAGMIAEREAETEAARGKQQDAPKK